MKKRVLAWMLGGLLLLSLCACGGPSDAQDTTDPNQDEKTQQDSEQEGTQSASNEMESGEGESRTLPSGLALSFSPTVPNDTTGNYRLSTTSSDTAPADCAQEYYENMFKSDDEIHAVWNKTQNTMTCLKVSSGLLFADTYEYVDGEENDAALLFSGRILDSKLINLSTGEVLES